MKKKIKKSLIILLVLIIVLVLVAIFLVVFTLAKQKKIFINKWFVNENKTNINWLITI